jgi:hypothetical protein
LLFLTPSHLLVVLAFLPRRAWLHPLVQRFNAAEMALPWLSGRHVGWWPNLPRSDSHEGGKAGRTLIFSSRLTAFMFKLGHHPTS